MKSQKILNNLNNPNITIVCFIVVLTIYIISLQIFDDKKSKPIVVASDTNNAPPASITNVSFSPIKVTVKDDDDNIGVLDITNYCFPPGTILLWGNDPIPPGWNLITMLNGNSIEGRFPLVRESNLSSLNSILGYLGGNFTTPVPTPFPPYVTLNFIQKQPFSPAI